MLLTQRCRMGVHAATGRAEHCSVNTATAPHSLLTLPHQNNGGRTHASSLANHPRCRGGREGGGEGGSGFYERVTNPARKTFTKLPL